MITSQMGTPHAVNFPISETNEICKIYGYKEVNREALEKLPLRILEEFQLKFTPLTVYNFDHIIKAFHPYYEFDLPENLYKYFFLVFFPNQGALVINIETAEISLTVGDNKTITIDEYFEYSSYPFKEDECYDYWFNVFNKI